MERTCKYGHGPLEMNPEVWQLPCFSVPPSTLQKEGIPGQRVFTLRLLVCNTCKYIEFADGDLQ